jgi:hypothetical protein
LLYGPAHRLVRDDGNSLQAHQFVGQPPHRSLLTARGRIGAGERDHVRLGRTIEDASIHPIRPLACQRPIQPGFDELAADAHDRGGMDLQRPGNGLVGSTRAAFALVGLEQDAGAGQHGFGCLAAPNPGSQSRSASDNYTADLVLRMWRLLGAAEI